MHRLQSAILMAMAFIRCGNNSGGTEEDATIEDLTTFDDGATVDYDATAEDTATFDDGATENGDATPGPRIKVADDNPRYFSYGDEVIFLNGVGPWALFVMRAGELYVEIFATSVVRPSRRIRCSLINSAYIDSPGTGESSIVDGKV